MTPNTENNEAGAQTPAFSNDGTLLRTDPPLHSFTLRPHRSLSPEGFVVVMAGTAIMLSIPLMAFLGTLAWWGLLPHLLAALGLLWYLMQRNTADGALREELKIWSDLVTVYRFNPRKPDQFWQANPYWIKVNIRENPHVKHYLTLSGSGREIELGAFLSPEERLDLRNRIEDALRSLHHQDCPV